MEDMASREEESMRAEKEEKRAEAARQRAAEEAARELEEARVHADWRAHLQAQLRVELHSPAQLFQLRSMLWVISIGRSSNRTLLRDDRHMNDRYLEHVGGTFPVVSSLCATGSHTALVARDIVFEMLAEI